MPRSDILGSAGVRLCSALPTLALAVLTARPVAGAAPSPHVLSVRGDPQGTRHNEFRDPVDGGARPIEPEVHEVCATWSCGFCSASMRVRVKGAQVILSARQRDTAGQRRVTDEVGPPLA